MGCPLSKEAYYDVWMEHRVTKSNNNMSLRKRPKVIVERKAWFLGRFLSRTLSEAAMAKLRSHLRLAKGVKTKLKLSMEGLSSGSKGGTIIKSKIPYEFTPLQDIVDIRGEEHFPNVILCIIMLQSGQYEILAYRFKTDEEVPDFRRAFYEITGKPLVQVVALKKDVLAQQYSNTSEESNASSGNWILQNQPRQSRTTFQRPRIPWGRSKSPGRDRSKSPVGRSSSPYGQSSRAQVTLVRSQYRQPTADIAVQTAGGPISARDLNGSHNVKSYSHRSRIFFRRNLPLADATCQVTSYQVPYNNGGEAALSRNDSLFRRIKNLSAEVQHIQDIVDSRPQQQSNKTPDNVDHIQSVDTLLNSKMATYNPKPAIHTSDMQTEGTVKVEVGDYRSNKARVHQNGNTYQSQAVRKSSHTNGSAIRSVASQPTSPAVFVTPATPEVTPNLTHPLHNQSDLVQGNYGRARSVVDGDFNDYPDNSRWATTTRGRNMAGSLRLVPANSLSHVSYGAPNGTLVSQRQSYPASVSGRVVGATVTSPTRLYRPIERVYFPHGAPTDYRRRVQSAPRPRH